MASRTSKIDIYPKSRTPALDPALFGNPTCEYRATPFWSWNARLRKDQLFKQIDDFKRMGFGGFHMHARTGLDTEYLGEEFLAMVRACADKAKSDHMLAWLYDEDRWPSGFAGGLVTADPRYRARHLLFTATAYQGAPDAPDLNAHAKGRRTENGTLLARYDVMLENGCLAGYRRMAEGEAVSAAKGRVWYAYLETALPSPWFNNQTYADTLSPEAIRKFVEVTHERYAKTVGEYFGNVVPAIFTDEPQFTHKQNFRRSDDTADIVMPFTGDFLATYEKTYGQKLEDFLPELFWELPGGKASLARYRYHDHIAERFAAAFADICGDWCFEHGIALTGHMMEEPTLRSQTAALGEAMRSYRSFHIPGIDMLCDRYEYTTAKQAQSAAHQYGRGGVLSELYGVTNWDFDFVGHKAQGDWQAALGVTVRVPHLAWVSMAGEAKRDYPAAISYQSPWYAEYPLVEDHFARINTVLTRGRPGVRIGVVHPVESFWLCFGPLEQTKVERQEREKAFENITQWLLFGLVDFDFLCESLLPSQCPKQSGPRLAVGEMSYEAVIVPAMRTIRSTTLDRLEAMAAAGGKVIFAGEVPTLVDAQSSDRAMKLAQCCTRVEYSGPRILDAIAANRDVEVRHSDGGPADSLIYQLRLDGEKRHIFFCNTDKTRGRQNTRIRLRGDWGVAQLDTFTGERKAIASRREGDWTVLDFSFPAHGSLLLTLDPGWKAEGASTAEKKWQEIGRLADPVPVTLSEPNVLLLDQAQWKLNEEPWQPLEEILRIDVAARKRLGLRMRFGGDAQPWTDTAPAPAAGRVALRFAICSEVQVIGAKLAVEDPQAMQIHLDGKAVSNAPDGWWVDESIRTLPLPSFGPGEHELVIELPFTRKTNLEWCYLLGNFGVEVRGRYAKLTSPVTRLTFGDWTTQGLPFYAGNVTYHCAIEAADQEIALGVPKFKNPLLSVTLDGKPAGKIAFAPFRLELGKLAKGPLTQGRHKLDITAFGNRANAFGQVHNCDPTWTWWGPNSWRTNGEQWAYEYQLRRTGIQVAPMVMGVLPPS